MTVVHSDMHTHMSSSWSWLFVWFRCYLNLRFISCFLPFCSRVVCLCCVRFSFLSTTLRDWLERTSPNQGRNHVFKVGGPIPWSRLLYRKNTDVIPSFVDCSLLRNGNHTLHQKSWGGPSIFWGVRTARPPVVAPLLQTDLFCVERDVKP